MCYARYLTAGRLLLESDARLAARDRAFTRIHSCWSAFSLHNYVILILHSSGGVVKSRNRSLGWF
jgi:hypothetical protein